MKKIILATATLAAIAAGTSAAQAKVNLDLHIGLPRLYAPAYEPVGYYGYDEPDCHYVTQKIVKWKNGHKIVKFKKVLFCD